MLKIINKRGHVPVALLRYCLLLLSVLFLSSSTHHVFGHSIESGKENTVKEAGFFPGNFSFISDISSKNQLPTVPAEEDPENSAETDDENNEEDYRLLNWIHSSSYAFSVSSCIKNHYYRFSRAYQNKATLPLYILFHSWKSYLL